MLRAAPVFSNQWGPRALFQQELSHAVGIDNPLVQRMLHKLLGHAVNREEVSQLKEMSVPRKKQMWEILIERPLVVDREFLEQPQHFIKCLCGARVWTWDGQQGREVLDLDAQGLPIAKHSCNPDEPQSIFNVVSGGAVDSNRRRH